MWYNATTSGRFFFFGKKADSTRFYPILYSAFRPFLYMVIGGTIKGGCNEGGVSSGEPSFRFSKRKKIFP